MLKDVQQTSVTLFSGLRSGMSRAEVIRTLAAALASGNDAERISRSALAREEEESTYLGHGLAVPHARLEGLPAPLVCLAPCPDGTEWNGERATLVALLVVPAERPELHLALLGTLARHLSTHRGTPDLPALAEQLRASV